jgi:hypothetical protein
MLENSILSVLSKQNIKVFSVDSITSMQVSDDSSLDIEGKSIPKGLYSITRLALMIPIELEL